MANAPTKTAAARLALAAWIALVSGCALLPFGDDYDASTRATDGMAPRNPARGARTMRVTTGTPPDFDVRLVTFYSQFHPQPNGSMQLLPRSGQVADGCWWSRSSFLQEERFHFTRVFHYPVEPGTSTQDLVLDEVLAGTCHLGITGIGYEVTLKARKGERYLVRFDIAVEEGGALSAQATVRCGLRAVQAGGKPQLRCERDGRRNAPFVGPLAPSGAALTLDFVAMDDASK
ncbi:hypothetical protein [Roseateles sp.]|uniref:hypothetical protein n=1 Tax=Roseateles sp. TaxID=1971397 RepID=UPI003267CF35